MRGIHAADSNMIAIVIEAATQRGEGHSHITGLESSALPNSVIVRSVARTDIMRSGCGRRPLGALLRGQEFGA